MNAEGLLRHYERVADAPDSIDRLRRFVLELAMRGKLVPQKSKDEPASELLKRIAKEQAANEGKKRREQLPPADLNQVPFGLPLGWAWARFPELGRFGRGKSKHRPRNDPALFEGGVHPMIQTGDVARSGGVIETYTGKYNNLGLAQSLKWPKGTLCVTIAANIADSGILSFDACFPDSVVGFVPASMFENARYFEYFVRTAKANLLEFAPATAQKNINLEILTSVLIPLPPLAEQHRIVAKVDELMALCDRLEAARGSREATRDRLVAASLARLNAPDPATFHDDARFALDALPALTTRPDQIKHLRQTILNLAVRGLLVPQEPGDEPAGELLKRIIEENKTLLAAKGIRPKKAALPVEKFEADSEVPPTWRHVYLQDLAYQITDGTHLTPKYTEAGKPFLSAQNVKPFRFIPDKHRFVSTSDFDNYRANRRPERGDILMTRVGAGIGEAAVLDSDFEFAFYVSLCLIKVPTRLISVDYLVLWLNSPEGRENSATRTYGKGASQGNLNLGLIRTFKIPLPPLAEQHRIVAKVDALMALCDRLEASLTATAATRRRLLDALLAEALAPAADRTMQAAE